MKVLRNIDSAVNAYKYIAITAILGSFALCSYNTWSTSNTVEKSREKIYVLNNGNSLELALARNPEANRKAEIKNHITMFHQFFYDLDPDPVDIKESVEKAMYLIGESGKQMQFAREESLYYPKLVDGSISTRVKIDSFQVDMSTVPYVVNIFARQKLIRPSKILFKNLISQCQVRNVKRTDNNPHGLLIERYRIIDNSTIKEISR